jgi:hypothetical protein
MISSRDTSEMPAAERLRAFEDRALGPGCSRPYGQIERGVGSRFTSLPREDQLHHAALLDLIDAENRRSAAQSALDQAAEAVKAAKTRVEATARHSTVNQIIEEP